MISGKFDNQIKEARAKTVLAKIDAKIAEEEENIIKSESDKLNITFENIDEDFKKLTNAFAKSEEAKERLKYLQSIKAFLTNKVEQ